MACVHISWLFMLWLIGFAKKKRRTFLRMVAAKQANFRSTRRMHGKQKHVGTKWLIFTLYMFRTGVQRHEEKRPGNKQKWKNTRLKEFFDDENIHLVQCFNLIICIAGWCGHEMIVWHFYATLRYTFISICWNLKNHFMDDRSGLQNQISVPTPKR